MITEYCQESPLHPWRLIECDPRPIRLCQGCLRHGDHIFIEGKQIEFFYPTVQKSWCECPCHDEKKGRAKFITLAPQLMFGELAEASEKLLHQSGRPNCNLNTEILIRQLRETRSMKQGEANMKGRIPLKAEINAQNLTTGGGNGV